MRQYASDILKDLLTVKLNSYAADSCLCELANLSYGQTTLSTSSDVETVLHELNKTTIIAIRGTKIELPRKWHKIDWRHPFRHVRDITRDLSITKHTSHGLTGHKGFLTGADDLYELLDNMRVFDNNNNFIITAHSMGGGIAIGLANRILLLGHNRLAKVVTFGAPPSVSNGLSRLSLHLHKIREYAFKDDAVAHSMHWSDYKHVNKKQLGARDRHWWKRRDLKDHMLHKYHDEFSTRIFYNLKY